MLLHFFINNSKIDNFGSDFAPKTKQLYIGLKILTLKTKRKYIWIYDMIVTITKYFVIISIPTIYNKVVGICNML